MLANPLGSWFKRWGIWLMLALFAVLFFIVKYMLPAPKGAIKVLDEARKATEDLKATKAKEHAELTQVMEAKATELKQIQTISDEEKRLQALADFANRKTKA